MTGTAHVTPAAWKHLPRSRFPAGRSGSIERGEQSANRRQTALIGGNRWPAVHRLDAAKLVQLAIDQARPGAVLHAVAEEGIATRDIAGALGKYLGAPVQSIDHEQAAAHFNWLGLFFGADIPASSRLTRDELGWAPRHPTLLEDIGAGHYSGR